MLMRFDDVMLIEMMCSVLVTSVITVDWFDSMLLHLAAYILYQVIYLYVLYRKAIQVLGKISCTLLESLKQNLKL